MSVRRFILLVCLAVPFGSVAARAAQDGGVPAAAVVAGTCAAPGDPVAALHDLVVRDGGEVLVSLTTIDLALADLLGEDHAIVLSDGGGVVACGDADGDADDVYIGVAASSDDGWGGVAWLHARDERTQVSLFVTRGLAGAAASPTEEPPLPPEDDTPTPGARATSTPRPTGTGTAGTEATYTSPTFGYSLVYDAKYWRPIAEETIPSGAGPRDVFSLAHGYIDVDFVGDTGQEGVTARRLCDAWRGQYETNPGNDTVTVREDTTGDDEQASVALDYTFTTDQGSTYTFAVWIGCYRAPDDSVNLSVFFRTTPASYARQAPVREALLAGLTFP
ncbi:MAG TPA: hypothetical protein VH482_22295 [Thermomicrobiales bacterium]|jgi:hypothetical protein